MGSQQSLAGELHGLHEKCVDALAEPSKGAAGDVARLRALLNDVLAAFGRIQGVGSGEDADEDEAEAASEVPDLGNEDDEDDEDAIDELAPVDADTEILRGLVWSDPTFPANGISLGFRNDVDEGRGPESRAC